MNKASLTEKFGLIHEHWRPKVVAQLNGQEVKLVKFQGGFPWHHHEHEDELFLVWRGQMAIEFRDGEPGRVGYLTGTRWPVWMIVQSVKEHRGNLEAVAREVRKPTALVRMALAYAAAYPEEIEACLKLHRQRDFEGLKRTVPSLEKL